MRPRFLLALICSTAAICAGCGDSGDRVVQDSFSSMKDMTNVLKTVKDEASAKAATPQLKAIANRMKDIGKRAEALKLTKEQQEALGQKYASQMMEAMPLAAEMMRVATLNIQDKDFQDAFKGASDTKPAQ